MRQLTQMNSHQAAEANRQDKLAADRTTYDAECRAREEKAAAANAELDSLKARLQIGEKTAVEEYFAIVFGNSVYPDAIDIDIEHVYRPADKELELGLRLPEPSALPTVKAYRYVKAKDEIVETAQSAKEQRDRYTNLVHGIVLRTLHEVWESDRAGHVQTIALTAGVEHIDPATGRPTTTQVLAVAADRSTFEQIDLAHVTPAETLKHLNAVVSKNPHALTPIALTGGVRG